MDLGLKGRTCAVTGASRGIGAETARQLCAEGANVLLVARGEERLREVQEEAVGAGIKAGGRAAVLALDVTLADAGERILATAGEYFGGLDVLVNNAGAASWRDLDDVPDEDWRAQYELNVMAPLRAMRAAAPAMAERGWGRIVNVCSTAGKRPSAAMPEYSVAKAAELSLSRLFADRYAKSGVLVNAICPGPTESEMWMDPGGLLDQSQAAVRRRQPRGGAGRGRRQAPDRPPRRPGRDRQRDRLPLLRPRLLRGGRRLVGRRGHRPSNHLMRGALALLRGPPPVPRPLGGTGPLLHRLRRGADGADALRPADARHRHRGRGAADRRDGAAPARAAGRQPRRPLRPAAADDRRRPRPDRRSSPCWPCCRPSRRSSSCWRSPPAWRRPTSPAKATAVPALVGDDELLLANSLTGVASNLYVALGPLVGGLLFAAGGAGAALAVQRRHLPRLGRC